MMAPFEIVSNHMGDIHGVGGHDLRSSISNKGAAKDALFTASPNLTLFFSIYIIVRMHPLCKRTKKSHSGKYFDF